MFAAPTSAAMLATHSTIPSATPACASCVVGTTQRPTTSPVNPSIATAFVNVPPTSTPTRSPMSDVGQALTSVEDVDGSDGVVGGLARRRRGRRTNAYNAPNI